MKARNRFVHLGDRLLALGRIRSGGCSIEEAARTLGVEVEQVRWWLEVHAGERTLGFEELRLARSPQAQRLATRAQQLATLVAEAEVELRALHQEYLRQAAASNEPWAEEPPRRLSKKLA